MIFVVVLRLSLRPLNRRVHAEHRANSIDQRALIQAFTLPFPVLKSCHGFSDCFYGLARIRLANPEGPGRALPGGRRGDPARPASSTAGC